MWSRNLDRKQTKIILHVVEIAGALCLGTLAPVVNIIYSKYQFGRFPPVLCLPSKEVSFYTVCLPLCIMMAIGTILAVIMFWILHKVSKTKTDWLATYYMQIKLILITWVAKGFIHINPSQAVVWHRLSLQNNMCNTEKYCTV